MTGFLFRALRNLKNIFNDAAEVLPGGPKKFVLLKNDSILETQSGLGWIGDKRALYRIQALVDIPAHGVKAGDLGGYVERERSLSHDGDSWVGGDARVFSQARVRDNALVDGHARVAYRAVVEDNAHVGGHSTISQWASVGGSAEVDGFSNLSWHSRADGTAKLQDAKLLMNTHVGSGSLTGEQQVSAADKKEMQHAFDTDPAYARLRRGNIGHAAS